MSLCSECAAIQVTCCAKECRDILVTQGDLARISEQLGGSQEFWEYRKPGDPAYLDQDDDPNWLIYTMRPDGTRKVLKKTAAHACIFLTETGCRFSEKIRPLVCRMFPFTYTEQGIDGVDEGECPVHLLPKGQELLNALDMWQEKAEEWRKMLYNELRAQKTA